MKFPKKIRILLILFLLVDFSISFNQYYNTPIDGDLTSILLPVSKFKPVLHDPSGVKAIIDNSGHSDSNRFFPLAITRVYFKTIPFLAQKVISPISSIYFSSALLKLFTQILIVLFISAFITGNFKISDDKFILASTLITIFFQVGGYNSTMGILDSSISYSISYTLTLALCLTLLYPIFVKIFHQKNIKINLPMSIYMVIIAVVVSFSGNQIPFLLFSIIIVGLVHRFVSRATSPFSSTQISGKKVRAILLIFLFFCCYSFFLSFYNSERNLLGISMIDRYKKIPIGLLNIIFGKPGLWILCVLIMINAITLKFSENIKSKSFNTTLKWALLFIFIYIHLLPFDGYYEFRPNIIRRDNFLPCTLVLVFLFVQSAFYLLENNPRNEKTKLLVPGYLLGVILLYTVADSPSLRIDNCQRASLEMLSISNEKVVVLSDQCTIASWYIITDSKNSEVNAKMFAYWNITKEPKYFYQQ